MTNPLPLGVYVGNPSVSDPSQEAKFQAALGQFSSAIGDTPTFIDTFVDDTAPVSAWVSNAQWSAASIASATDTKIMTPVIGVPMASWATGSLSAMDSFSAISSGAWDSTYLGIVDAYKAQGFSTIDLRLGWEMNGSWEKWSPQNATEAAAFVQAFQHIAGLVHDDAGIKVNVVWNPDVINWSAVPVASLYPGDQYVDVVAADLYSPTYPGSLYDWSTGQIDTSYAQWVANPVNVDHYWDYPDANQWNPTGTGAGWGLVDAMNFAKAHDKPFGLAETGAGNNGTTTGPVDDPRLADYLTQRLLAPSAPSLAFVNVWDVNVSDGNWDFSDGSRPLEQASWANLVAASRVGVVDPGPSITPSGTIVAGGQTVSLGSQLLAGVTPGAFGDTETITAVSAARGNAVLGGGSTVTYTAPASGADTLTYTVTDQLGDSSTGTYTITADPGPSAGSATVTRPSTWSYSIGPQLLALVTPGLQGDHETITAVTALYGKITLGAYSNVSYTEPASGTDKITYTATDQRGYSSTGTLTWIVDTGPKLAAGGGTVVANSTVSLASQILALITPGAAGDTDTITSVKAIKGTVTLGAGNAVTYTAPASGVDTLTYSVTNQWGQITYGNYMVTADPVAKLASGGAKVVPKTTVDLTSRIAALITPGAYGDVETITAIKAAHGKVTLGAGNVVSYTAPGTGTDTLTYTVTDQFGAASTGTYAITTDPGPAAGSTTAFKANYHSFAIGPQLLSLVTPGLSGDTDTITAVSAMNGKVTLGAYSSVNYAVPASGTDTVTFTVTNQLGESATGTLHVVVDTGPTLAAGSQTVTSDSTISLTSQIAALITPGAPGDVETISAIKAAHGTVTLGAGNAITYTAPAGGTDTLSYTVTDQWGHSASGSDAIVVSAQSANASATVRLASSHLALGETMATITGASHAMVGSVGAGVSGLELMSLGLVQAMPTDLGPDGGLELGLYGPSYTVSNDSPFSHVFGGSIANPAMAELPIGTTLTISHPVA